MVTLSQILPSPDKRAAVQTQANITRASCLLNCTMRTRCFHASGLVVIHKQHFKWRHTLQRPGFAPNPFSLVTNYHERLRRVTTATLLIIVSRIYFIGVQYEYFQVRALAEMHAHCF